MIKTTIEYLEGFDSGSKYAALLFKLNPTVSESKDTDIGSRLYKEFSLTATPNDFEKGFIDGYSTTLEEMKSNKSKELFD